MTTTQSAQNKEDADSIRASFAAFDLHPVVTHQSPNTEAKDIRSNLRALGSDAKVSEK